jgi:hypothetical protein
LDAFNAIPRRTNVITSFYETPASQLRYIIIRHLN